MRDLLHPDCGGGRHAGGGFRAGAAWQLVGRGDRGRAAGRIHLPPVAQLATIAWFNTTESNNAIGFRKADGPNAGAGTVFHASMLDGGGYAGSTNSLGLSPGPHRAAMTWGGGTLRGALSGALGGQVAQRDPVPTKLWLGQRDGGSTPLNGWLRRVACWPRRLTDAQLQSATQ
ncbi:hypothetical protein MASR1M32_24000 [Rhodobacter sp.]